MKSIFSLTIPTLFYLTSCAQQMESKLIGGRCEGCEAVLEYGDLRLSNRIKLPDSKGEKLVVSGTIYESDGLTSAEGVIMYLYHTDARGIYPSEGNEKDWSRRHGRLRGWIKTGKDGRYSFETIRPASYPNTTIQQHIHATILEPDGSYYFISDFLFEDDPYLPAREKNRSNPRGGPGHVLKLKKEKDIWKGKRNITLRAGI